MGDERKTKKKEKSFVVRDKRFSSSRREGRTAQIKKEEKIEELTQS